MRLFDLHFKICIKRIHLQCSNCCNFLRVIVSENTSLASVNKETLKLYSSCQMTLSVRFEEYVGTSTYFYVS